MIDELKMHRGLEVAHGCVHEVRERLAHMFMLAFCLNGAVPKGNADGAQNWAEIVEEMHDLLFALDHLRLQLSPGEWGQDAPVTGGAASDVPSAPETRVHSGVGDVLRWLRESVDAMAANFNAATACDPLGAEQAPHSRNFETQYVLVLDALRTLRSTFGEDVECVRTPPPMPGKTPSEPPASSEKRAKGRAA